MILVINTTIAGKIEFCLSSFSDMGHADPIHTSISTEKQSLDLPAATAEFVGDFSNITAIGVVVGPGSFTGIRLGIAYAKGLALGRGIPLIGINAFDIYLQRQPDAFIAIDSGKGDFFVAAHNLPPQVMTIGEVETKQFDYPKTIGHEPFDLRDALPVLERKLKETAQPVIPMYLKPSYAESLRK